MSEKERMVLKVSKTVWNKCIKKPQDGDGVGNKETSSKNDSICDMRSFSSCGGCSSEFCSSCCTLKCSETSPTSVSLSPVSKRGRKRKLSSPSVSSDAIMEFVSRFQREVPEAQQQRLLPAYRTVGHYQFTYANAVEHIISLRIEYIQRLIRPILSKFMTHPRNASVFNNPVDVVGLKLFDYYKKIKTPMDLGTVKGKLQAGTYTSLDKCIAEISLVFKNAMLYNPSTHTVHIVAAQLLEELNEDVKVMKERVAKEEERKRLHRCELCTGSTCLLCGEKCLKLESPILVCHGGCNSRIKKNTVYYVTSDGEMLWCQKCYNCSSPVIFDSPQRSIHKKHLLKRRNTEEIVESWVECSTCNQWVHQVCGLYNHHEKGDYRCMVCDMQKLYTDVITSNISSTSTGSLKQVCRRRAKSGSTDGDSSSSEESDDEGSSIEMEDADAATPVEADTAPSAIEEPTTPYSASTLPTTHLSDFMEAVVAERLASLNYPHITPSITIRMVSNTLQYLEVPEVISDNIPNKHKQRISTYIPYRQKCILVFQKINNNDVCIFCVYLHEFDSTVPEPNTNRVYIAYLDSIDYFRPREVKTILYHEILVAYLKYSSYRGFHHAHIWSCPPQRGDNFIFWCHPTYQKIPSRERLHLWYESMLKRAKHCDILKRISNLWEVYFSQYNIRYDVQRSRNNLLSSSIHSKNIDVDILCPPIFDGDYWINECLRLHKLVQQKHNTVNDSSINNRKARELLKNMMQKASCYIFNAPVDIVALNIPDYPQVVPNPMDLGTIKENLRCHNYENMLEFVEDVRLTFRNAMRYNPPGHPVHVLANKYLTEFEQVLLDLITERVGILSVPSQTVDDWLIKYPLKSKTVSFVEPESTVIAGDAAPVACSDATEKGNGSVGGEDGGDTPLEFDRTSTVGDDDNFYDAASDGFVLEDEASSGALNDSGSTDFIRPARLRRHDSIESIASLTSELIHNRSAVASTLQCSAPTASMLEKSQSAEPFVESKLGGKGSLMLMTELSRNVFRLKDDIFVVDFKNSFSRTAQNDETSTSSLPADDLAMHESSTIQDEELPAGKGKSNVLALEAVAGASAADTSISTHSTRLLDDIPIDTTEPDPLISQPFVDSRHTFLEMCQYGHYQFDTLRRAKYSSMMLLYYLHNPHAPHLRPQCQCCHHVISELRWHCDQCPSFDICNDCSTTHAHEHVLTPMRITFV